MSAPLISEAAIVSYERDGGWYAEWTGKPRFNVPLAFGRTREIAASRLGRLLQDMGRQAA